MRTLRNLSIIGISLIYFISSCVKQPRVYVETGNITGTTFTGIGPFNANHNAIGKIDSAICTSLKFRKFNGYKLADKNVYVFEKNEIPKKIKKLNVKKLNDTFNQASWSTDIFQYELKHDALVCEDPKNYTYYSRKAGNTIRQTAVIDGNKVYRFVDNVQKEKYDQLKDYHTVFRNEEVNFFEKLGISQNTHFMHSDSLKIFADLGRIDFSSRPTPLNGFDKLYFKPIEKENPNGETYMLRVVLKKKNSAVDSLDKYFVNFKSGEKTNNEIGLTNYLYGQVLPEYWPQFIRGYDCNGCKPNEIKLPNIDLKSNSSNLLPPSAPLTPPLPIINNY